MFDPTSPTTNIQQDDLWKDVINPEPIIQRIELTMQGYTWNDNKGVWVKEYNEIMSKAGLTVFMWFLRNLISKNIIMGFLGENEIRIRCKNNRNALIHYLAKNYTDIELNVQNLTLVLNVVDDNVNSIFSRSKNAKMLNSLGSSTKRLESYIQRPEGGGAYQQKKPFFGFFKGG